MGDWGNGRFKPNFKDSIPLICSNSSAKTPKHIIHDDRAFALRRKNFNTYLFFSKRAVCKDENVDSGLLIHSCYFTVLYERHLRK